MDMANLLENGAELAVAGMFVVFTGLALISLYIAAIPLAVRRVDAMRAIRKQRAAAPVALAPVRAVVAPADDLTLMAALAFVVQAEMERTNTIDDHRITIQRDESQRVWAVAGKMRTLSTRL
jgi:Na+-transporting methylmalonyl-CoA/oxaloacetate decarboxylase gamma subunit